MASVLPRNNLGKIQWYQNHIATWTTNVTQIGLVLADVTAVDAAAQAAADAFTAQQLAQDASKLATQNLETKLKELQSVGGGAIKKIRGKATAAGAGGTAIYTLAGMSAPTPPSPVGAPGTPSDLKVTLNPDGSVTLKWKCANPANAAGTVYNLGRKNAGAAAFAPVGTSGAREFTDLTIPAGTASVVYQIVAVRSTRSGTAAEFVVNFGVSGAGEAFASVAPSSSSPKLAA